MKVTTKISVFLLAVLSWCLPASLNAQAGKLEKPSTMGSEFWVAFLNNRNADPANDASYDLEIIVTAPQATTIKVEAATGATIGVLNVPAGGWDTLALDKGQIQNLCPYEMKGGSSGENMGIRVYTDNPENIFSCFAYNRQGTKGATSRDATLVLPVDALGQEYVIQTFNQEEKSTEFVIVAIEDDTKLTISTENSVTDAVKGIGSEITLHRGQTYFVASIPAEEEAPNVDLSGSTVCSTHPVAVFVGNQAALAPYKSELYAGDHTYEQILPIQNLGRKYYIGLAKNTLLNNYIVSAAAPTTVSVSGAGVSISKPLGVGESLLVSDPDDPDELPYANMLNASTPNVVIESEQPIMTFNYLTAPTMNTADNVAWGDIANALVPSWEQRVNKMTFFTKILDPQKQGGQVPAQKHFVQITCRKQDIGSLKITDEDGTVHTAGSDYTYYTADPAMVYASIELPGGGGHTVTCGGEGFVGYVYGISMGQSYLYTLGYNPFPNSDSLFIDLPKEKNIMSDSYDLESMPNGWYQRQTDYWPVGQERLDTAYICDGSSIPYKGRIAVKGPVDSVVYQVLPYDLDDQQLTTPYLRKTMVDPSQEYQLSDEIEFYIDPQKDLPAEERKPYFLFQTQLLIYRQHTLCPSLNIEDPLIDTLLSMVQVNRVYDDTIPHLICTGDSIRFFRDSFPDQEVWNKLVGNIASMDDVEATKKNAPAKETWFVGYKNDWEKPDARDFRYPSQSGEHFYQRRYTTIHGCDSIVTLHLFVCDTIHHRVEDRALSPSNDYKLVFPDIENTMFAGETITKPGIYRDTLRTQICHSCLKYPYDIFEDHDGKFGCDSIIELHVISRDTIIHTFCDSVYNLTTREKTLNTKNFYEKTMEKDTQKKPILPTDKIYSKDKDRMIPFDSVQIVTIEAYPNASEFVEEHWTAEGMDSSFVFLLTAEPLNIIVEPVTITPTDTYYWKVGTPSKIFTMGPYKDSIGVGKPYPEDTKVFYYHYVQNEPSLTCQKTITRLEITLGFRKDTTLDVCDNDSVHWRGQVIVSKKYLMEHYMDPDDYDVCYNCKESWSIAPCHTKAWPNGFIMYDDTVKGDPTLGELDSIYGLKLRVYPTYIGDDYQTNTTQHICLGETFTFGDNEKHGWEEVINSMTYEQELNTGVPNNQDGTNPNLPSDDATHTNKHPYVVKDFYHTFSTICAAGDGVVSPEGKNGCDSVSHLQLYIWKSYNLQDTVYLCWDSVVNKNDIYEPAYPFESHAASYRSFYNTPGDFTETGQTRDPSRVDKDGVPHQCDSTVRVLIYVSVANHIDSVRHTPDSKAIKWQGKTYGPWKMGTDTIIRDTVVHHDGIWKGQYPKDASGKSLLPKGMTCDSTHCLELHIHPTYREQVPDKVCQDKTAGAYYQWEGHGSNNLYVFPGMTQRVRADKIPLKDPGFISLVDSMHTKNCEACGIGDLKCDSVVMLNLAIRPLYPHELELDSACQKKHYWWKDHQVQYENDPSATPFFDEDGEAVTISTEEANTDAEPYYTYVDKLNSIYGCDSTYTMQLYVHPSYTDETNIITIDSAFCYNDVKDGYHWADTVVNSVGVYRIRRTFQTAKCKCDSVVTYTLTVFRDMNVGHRDTLCTNDKPKSYEYHGTVDPSDKAALAPKMENGWYVDIKEVENVISSEKSCSYFDTLLVFIHDAFPGLEMRDTVCKTPGAFYTWNMYEDKPATRGENREVWDEINQTRIKANAIPIDEKGMHIYVDSMKTSTCKCDSIWKLRLLVNETYSLRKDTTLSDEASYKWEHKIYVGPLVNTDTLSNSWFAPEWHEGDDEALKPEIVHVAGLSNTYTASYQTKANAHPCDSIWTLSMKVGKVFRDTTWDYVCDNCEYRWTIKSPITGENTVILIDNKPAVGDTMNYYLNLKTSLGFDSIFVLRLTTMPTYNLQDEDNVCQGSTNSLVSSTPVYIWNNHMGATNHLWRDEKAVTTIHTRDSGWVTIVDSLKTQTLFYDPKTKTSRPTACDSIWVLKLYVSPSYNETYNKEEVTQKTILCSNDTVSYDRILFAGYDYDSKSHPLAATGADYDKVVYLQQSDLKDDIYYYQREIGSGSAAGCDSTIFLELTISPRGYHYFEAAIGDNDTKWSFGGQPGHTGDAVTGADFHLKHPEQYELYRKPYDTLLIDTAKIDGCDYIEHCRLTVYPTYRFVLDTAVCSNNEWNWRKYKGINYLPSGTYYDSIYTKAGYDSVFVLNMDVVPAFEKVYHKDMCKNDTIYWEKYVIFYEEGDDDEGTMVDYIATYKTSGSCDSVYHMYASFFDYYPHVVEYDTVCQYDNYHWIDAATGREHIHQLRDTHGNHLSAVPTDTTFEIVIYDSLRTEYCHCDSTYELRLYVKPSHRYYDYDYVMCSTDTLLWHDNYYSRPTAGYIRDTIGHMNEFGCDSTYFLEVRVEQAYLFELTDTVCADQMPYVWPLHDPITASREEALTWTKDTVFLLWDSLHTVHGCDSIYRMQVTVHPILRTYNIDTICVGDTLLHIGHQLTQTGVYVDTIQSSVGCDSIVTLSLLVIPPTALTVGEPTVCANEKSYDVPFRYKGLSPISYYVTYDSLAMVNGFDTVPSVVILEKDSTLTIPMPEPLNGLYIEPNNYTGVIHFDNGVCLNLDPLMVPFVLEVRYPAESVVEQHWNDFFGILVPEINGGYAFSSYQWYRNDSLLAGETGPYLYEPHYLDVNSYYTVALTREGDSVAYMTCPIVPIIERVDTLMPTMPYVSVVPTLVVKENPVVNILSVNEGNYRLYNAYGKLVTTGTFTPDEHFAMTVTMPAVSGVYIFELNEKTGLRRSVKVIVE